MKVRCEYCNNLIDDSDEVCPGCNAPNKDYKQVANEVPTTIEELQRWYEARGLPPKEITRFFIGEDYKEPKAFGIYKDDKTGKFVVYKNKDTGERAIRYEGKDEKYAVNEIYLKLKDEIAMRKNKNSSIANSKKIYMDDLAIAMKSIGLVFSALFFIMMIGIVLSFISLNGDRNGYYTINEDTYYNHNDQWYIYTDDGWEETSKPQSDDELKNYYDGDTYYNNDSYTDIRDSDYYDSSWDYSSDNDSSSWDSDSDWDSDSSWDSGGSDWSSDW